ncbi:MAG: nicotinate (nicotinamide) nucleotide adenylyltransferase [Proteobacteria bacterium]|nr:nicotinate (nicotinamide) nucleotide adenylyltransferase [Pseudomonadota bacterium]
MSRIAILGGSFNPPHLGHQLICTWALSTGQAEAIWLLPVWQHAFDKPLAPFEHRLAMCRLAAAPFAAGSVAVCGIEAELRGPSRTLITFQHLIARHPQHAFSLLVGADVLEQTQAWYGFEALARLAPIIVVGRAGHAAAGSGLALANVSSTEVRSRVALGFAVDHLLPQAVCAYIGTHGIYRGATTDAANQSSASQQLVRPL